MLYLLHIFLIYLFKLIKRYNKLICLQEFETNLNLNFGPGFPIKNCTHIQSFKNRSFATFRKQNQTPFQCPQQQQFNETRHFHGHQNGTKCLALNYRMCHFWKYTDQFCFKWNFQIFCCKLGINKFMQFYGYLPFLILVQDAKNILLYLHALFFP